MYPKIFVLNGIFQVDTVIDLSEQSQNDPAGSSSTAERCIAHTITIIALKPLFEMALVILILWQWTTSKNAIKAVYSEIVLKEFMESVTENLPVKCIILCLNSYLWCYWPSPQQNRFLSGSQID